MTVVSAGPEEFFPRKGNQNPKFHPIGTFPPFARHNPGAGSVRFEILIFP
jgi:hypothetical protein